MNKTTATTNEGRKCKECRNFESHGCGTQGTCAHWTSEAGHSGIVITTHTEWKACNGFDDAKAEAPTRRGHSCGECDHYDETTRECARAAAGDKWREPDYAACCIFTPTVTSEAAQVVAGRDGTPYTVEQLSEIFDAVSDPDDWKAPIAAWIPASTYDAVGAAVEFYTGTWIRVAGGPELGTGRILIEAEGYRAGPAGDH